MDNYLGAVVGRQLGKIQDAKKAEQLYEIIQRELVDGCNAGDRLEALCDLPDSLETSMQLAWTTKDYIEFMRLFRVLMCRFFDAQAADTASRQMEYGD